MAFLPKIKRDVVLNEIELNKIDLCCVQETEIKSNYPFGIMRSRKYEFEAELNNDKYLLKTCWSMRSTIF